jgi:DNA-binding NtrC family response regulator
MTNSAQQLDLAAPHGDPGRTVLVVDDDSLLRKALGDALRSRGMRALVAGSLSHTLDVFVQNEVDVVLLDEQLPDGLGHTICDRLTGLRPGTKIVCMTAFPGFEHAVKALRAGAYDYLA